MINYKHYIFLLFFMPRCIQAVDTEWNGQFNIGREIVTSEGYTNFVTGAFCYKEPEGGHVGYFNYLSYGLTRSLGCTFTIPTYIKFTDGEKTLRGLADLQLILQWQAYRTEEHMFLFEGGMTFPTGNKEGAPFLGTGSFNPIAYLCAIHSSEKLFASFEFGGVFTTERKHFKAGSYLDYRLDIGPKFPLSADLKEQIYIFLVLQGFHILPNQRRGKNIPNTGGHLLLCGPSITYDGYANGAQLNFFLPICDRKFGIQPSTDFFISFWLGWSF